MLDKLCHTRKRLEPTMFIGKLKMELRKLTTSAQMLLE